MSFLLILDLTEFNALENKVKLEWNAADHENLREFSIKKNQSVYLK